MKKLLLKLFQRFIYQPELIDEKKMKDWLFKGYQEQGFKNYYTMRKRYLVNLLIWEDDKFKRAEAKGRLNELQGLSANMTEEFNRRKEQKPPLKS